MFSELRIGRDVREKVRDRTRILGSLNGFLRGNKHDTKLSDWPVFRPKFEPSKCVNDTAVTSDASYFQ